MERILTTTINLEIAGMSVYQYLHLLGFSSQNISALKRMPNGILVNGILAYSNYCLQEMDFLQIHIQEMQSSPNIVPNAIAFSILYEDEDILVINKSAGMPIHPSQNHYENTLANAVAYYYQSQNIPYVFRCINRLDKDTSGLTILAKHMLSAAILSEMVRTRSIKREYLAICEGIVTPTIGTVDAPIGRLPGSTIERIVDYSAGEHAVTHYRVLSSKENLSLLLLWLETGRTHQIRVHMKEIGFPLIGDFLYYPDFSRIKRQALHSYRLTFLHPITKEPLCFEAPLPDDMRILCDKEQM